MASGPPSALACPGCKGKYTLLNPGEVHCEVCSSVFQLSRLVWGTRFPTGLRQNAARAVHSCYLQLLKRRTNTTSTPKQLPPGVGRAPGVGELSWCQNAQAR